MKLFIWNKGVMRAYTDGLAVAMAETVEQAREVLLVGMRVEQERMYAGHPRCKVENWIRATMDKRAQELSKPPDEVYDAASARPHAAWLQGSS